MAVTARDVMVGATTEVRERKITETCDLCGLDFPAIEVRRGECAECREQAEAMSDDMF